MSTAPTPKQLSYLTALVEKAGLTQDEWRESVGLYDHSPWGKRLRTEMISRSAVSRWIDDLKARATSLSKTPYRKSETEYHHVSPY